MGHNKSQNWYNSLSQRDKEKAQEFVYGSYSVGPVTGQQMDVMQKKNVPGCFPVSKISKMGKAKTKAHRTGSREMKIFSVVALFEGKMADVMALDFTERGVRETYSKMVGVEVCSVVATKTKIAPEWLT